MRCLTLADELKGQGLAIKFITRAHLGNMGDAIAKRGYDLCLLPAPTDAYQVRKDDVMHASWLGVSWEQDAEESRLAIGDSNPEWLIVDHYGIDARWHRKIRNHIGQIMVIDDLADRAHYCDLLLDQNLGRRMSDYTGLVSKHCKLLVGPKYALLRREFLAHREYSLVRRKKAQVRQLLISMGGVDEYNATGRLLELLKKCLLPVECRIIVVMGENAPWLDVVRQQADSLHWRTNVLVNISDMAQRMADSDLAIGAGGSSAWERCCLGLPSVVVPIAENQRSNCSALSRLGAATYLNLEDLEAKDSCEPSNSCSTFATTKWLAATSSNASRIVDGKGVIRTTRLMLESD